MTDIKVVAFDCDGVLFETRRANEAYYNRILARFGMPEMTDAQTDYTHMHTVHRSLDSLFEDPKLRAQADAYRQEMNYDDLFDYLIIEPYLKTLLHELRPQYATAIATNRTDTMERLLGHFGLENYFDLVVTALDVVKPKPHPEALLTIAAHFQISPNQILYLGDSQVDEQAAKAAGVPLVAFKNPALRAPYYIDRLEELLPILSVLKSRN